MYYPLITDIYNIKAFITALIFEIKRKGQLGKGSFTLLLFYHFNYILITGQQTVFLLRKQYIESPN